MDKHIMWLVGIGVVGFLALVALISWDSHDERQVEIAKIQAHCSPTPGGKP